MIDRNNNKRKDDQRLDRVYRELKMLLQEMWEEDPQFVINKVNTLPGVRIINLPGHKSTLMEIEE